jgi:hypothetical protein
MAAKLALPGTYVFRFAGFDRDATRARHVAGVGQMVLTETGAGQGTIESGAHRVTNSPMSGQAKDLVHSTYDLSGTYAVIAAGPPILATATVTFTKTSVDGRRKMVDTFAIVQSGPDRLWLVSTDPRELDEADKPTKKIEELVVGELVKVDMATW